MALIIGIFVMAGNGACDFHKQRGYITWFLNARYASRYTCLEYSRFTVSS